MHPKPKTSGMKIGAVLVALVLLFSVSISIYADESTRDTSRESPDVRDPVDVELVDQAPTEESEDESPTESSEESEETLLDESVDEILETLDSETEEVDSYYKFSGVQAPESGTI